jgi:hypothetical protein
MSVWDLAEYCTAGVIGYATKDECSHLADVAKEIMATLPEGSSRFASACRVIVCYFACLKRVVIVGR